MTHEWQNLQSLEIGGRAEENLDLNALLHPAQAFAHPMDVVRDLDLTLNEKRAILASWASDACAVEAAPALRQVPGGRLIGYDEVMDALRMLDKQMTASRSDGNRRRLRRRMIFERNRNRDRDRDQGNHGAPLV
jgi:hypothetical protein